MSKKERRAKRRAQKMAAQEAAERQAAAQLRSRRTVSCGIGLCALASIGLLANSQGEDNSATRAATPSPTATQLPTPQTPYYTQSGLEDVTADTLLRISEPPQLGAQNISYVRSMFESHYRRSLPGFQYMRSFEPIQLETYLGFAPDHPQVIQYIEQQTKLTQKIQEYFELDTPFEFHAAQSKADLIKTDDIFAAYIVAKREARVVFKAKLLVNGQEQDGGDINIRWMHDVSDINAEWTLLLRQGNIDGMRRQMQEVVIPAHHSSGISGPLEYVHYATAPVFESEYLARVRGQPLENNRAPDMNAELLKNEGIVHATVLRALVELDELTPTRADEILRHWDEPQYQLVRHYYERTRREGARKVFHDYTDAAVERK